MNAHDILQAAAGHMRDRAATYDKPEGERSMGRAVEAFNAITGRDLSESEGWLLLQVLKSVRLFARPGYHADSAEDCVAYAALVAESACAAQAASEFGHQNQYTGQGGVMLHCPDCTAEHCPCMAK